MEPLDGHIVIVVRGKDTTGEHCRNNDWLNKFKVFGEMLYFQQISVGLS
jgi:hypothetical protein